MNTSFGTFRFHFSQLLLLAAGLMCMSQAYCQDSASLPTPEIYITLINSTDTEAHINVSEEMTKRPYTYLCLKTLVLSPRQTISTSLVLATHNTCKRTLSLFTSGGQGYGQTGSNVVLDVSKSETCTIVLTEAWVYPGEESWPPVPPFRVIKARIQSKG